MGDSRLQDIEQQIAHLRWLKMQNERSIKTTLLRSRVLQKNDMILKMSADATAERSVWKTSVIRDELSKPLVLSDNEVYNIRIEDELARERDRKTHERQLASIQKVEKDLMKKWESKSTAKDSIEEPLSHFEVMKSLVENQLQASSSRHRKGLSQCIMDLKNK